MEELSVRQNGELLYIEILGVKGLTENLNVIVSRRSQSMNLEFTDL